MSDRQRKRRNRRGPSEARRSDGPTPPIIAEEPEPMEPPERLPLTDDEQRRRLEALRASLARE